MATSLISPITTLPKNLPLDGAIAITLQDGVMLFRASQNIQQRIENLLDKREETPLTETEEQELDDFEAIDDYTSNGYNMSIFERLKFESKKGIKFRLVLNMRLS